MGHCPNSVRGDLREVDTVHGAENRSVIRAIGILDGFSADQPELGVREIARRLRLSSSTTGRLAATLAASGVLTQDPTTLMYRLGPRVLAWAGLYTAALDIRTTARPILERLRRATRETTALYVLDGQDRVCVERLEGPESIRAFVRLGERMPLYAGAGGKVLLAFLPPDSRASIVKRLTFVRFTPHTIGSRRTLESELEAIRRRGYATSAQERFEGGASVAAPVHGADGALIGAVNVFGPADRFTGARQAAYVKHVTSAAAALSRAMGYVPVSLRVDHRQAKDRETRRHQKRR
jgi:DNA-binding IclR family transcriptional regulator